MPNEIFRVVSLGWGAQSFGLAAMSALGILPKVDFAIFADTTHERTSTYEFANKWKPWLKNHGINVIIVKPENINPIQYGMVMIPARTGSESGGLLRRQCTSNWKLSPIRKWLQANREKRPVELWLGITFDEIQRIKPSDVKYISNRWPFLESELWQGRMMRRSDVVIWLKENNFDIPSRSACYFCPYHNDREWRDLRDNGNGDWKKAIDFDGWLRDKRPPYSLYLHRHLVPLSEVDLSTPEDYGQLSLFDDECEGICGV
jgi:hypothetical protein